MILRMFVVLLLVSITSAYADDSSEGVFLPGLRSDPIGAVRVSSASVEIRSSSDVEVLLRLTRDSVDSSAARTKLSIRMPHFGWLGEADPYPDRHFPELGISVDSKPTVVQSSFVVFAGNTDVTKAIQDAELDPFLIADSPPLVRLESGKLADLLRLQAIRKEDDEFLANWTAGRTVTFDVSSGAFSEVRLKYKARPAYELLSWAELVSAVDRFASYCLSVEELIRSLGGRVQSPHSSFVVSRYEIPVSVDGVPVQSVSIAIDMTDIDESKILPFVAFCGEEGRVTGMQFPLRAQIRTGSDGIIRILTFVPAMQHSR